MKKLNREIGQRIRQTREKRSMSASDLARLTEVTPTAVWNWENNGIRPRPDTLATIAQVLGVTKDYLLAGERQDSSEIRGNTTATATATAVAEMSLEDLIRAIGAKGFEVTIRPKTT